MVGAGTIVAGVAPMRGVVESRFTRGLRPGLSYAAPSELGFVVFDRGYFRGAPDETPLNVVRTGEMGYSACHFEVKEEVLVEDLRDHNLGLPGRLHIEPASQCETGHHGNLRSG